jgi:hypothetical protein
LVLAEIPPSKLGATRRARLSSGERDLYSWILRQFATAGRPSASDVRQASARLGLDTEATLETLAREDLVHRGSGGELTVAYPFSGLPTAHRVRFASGHEVHAMCAIDALGIAPMLDEPIEIASRDPLTDEEITAMLDPAGSGSWQPQSAVVVCGVRGNGDSCRSCCPVLNFFASPENAEQWLAEQDDARGEVISMDDAIVAGRAVFGDVLEEAS